MAKTRPTTALLAGLLLALTLSAPASASTGDQGGYVALGDSYTSAPGVPQQDASRCGRSDHNYPHLVAAAGHARAFTDVSCGGATTVDLTRTQPGTGNPPQLDALTRRTRLVTLGIGGNDAGFGALVGTCSALSGTDPTGAPCKAHFTAGGVDQAAEAVRATAPKVGAALAEIARRAPHARILLVGYPTVVPAAGTGCWPSVPIAAGDVAYLRDWGRALNRMLARQADAHDAEYVDTARSSTGHDVCQATGVRWVEGSAPTSPAAPWHPNALGEANMARRVLGVLRD